MRKDRENNVTASERDSYRRSEMEFGVAADAYRSDPSRKATRNGAVMVAVSFALVAFAAVAGLWWLIAGSLNIVGVVVAILAGLGTLSSTHVCLEWERCVVMRLGRFSRLAGPGLFFTIPVIEFCTLRVDQRTIATPFGAEEALTSDLVPLDVDAVLFWMIWDPEKACSEVEDCRFAVALTAQTALRDAIGRASVSPLDVDAVLFWMIWDPEKACSEVEDCRFAVALTAQTALRDAIGRASVSNVVMRRHQLDQELQEAVEAKVTDWGITVLSVEVRDIIIPKELQGVMSLEAQAECRKNARITLMEAERDVSAILQEVAEEYSHDETALALRKMHLVYEGMQDTDGTLVVPSAYTEGFTVDPNKGAQQGS